MHRTLLINRSLILHVLLCRNKQFLSIFSKWHFSRCTLLTWRWRCVLHLKMVGSIFKLRGMGYKIQKIGLGLGLGQTRPFFRTRPRPRKSKLGSALASAKILASVDSCLPHRLPATQSSTNYICFSIRNMFCHSIF